MSLEGRIFKNLNLQKKICLNLHKKKTMLNTVHLKLRTYSVMATRLRQFGGEYLLEASSGAIGITEVEMYKQLPHGSSL